jgi:2-octaprenyl-6-methoxyphenol hydroxylase
MTAQDTKSFDIAVVGAGAVGLVCALALAQRGRTVAMIGPAAARRDGRTVALMDGSVRFLEELGVWQAIAPHGSPLAALTLIDDTGSLFRAPALTFHAGEIGLDAFGMNVEAATLVRVLAEEVAARPHITTLPAPLRSVVTGPDRLTVTLEDGSLAAKLVVGADGRHSLVREAAGLASRHWSYPQSALTAILAHERDHHDTSTEFHTRHGPFTLVPLQGRRSSLVWLMQPQRADALSALDAAAFGEAVERQAQSMLGAMRLDGPRGCVPMAGLSVERFTAARTAIAGEAAHVFPPIGAQGLNLGLRDAADLAAAVDLADDPGDVACLAAYERARSRDVTVRSAAVDALNRSLLAGFLPVDLLRSGGIAALSAIAPLRRFVMRQGLGSG